MVDMIRLPCGLSAQHVGHTSPGKISSRSVGVLHVVHVIIVLSSQLLTEYLASIGHRVVEKSAPFVVIATHTVEGKPSIG